VNKGLLMGGLSMLATKAMSSYNSMQLEKAQLSESMGNMVYNMLEVGGWEGWGAGGLALGPGWLVGWGDGWQALAGGAGAG
jgi:hypothetical protein